MKNIEVFGVRHLLALSAFLAMAPLAHAGKTTPSTIEWDENLEYQVTDVAASDSVAEMTLRFQSQELEPVDSGQESKNTPGGLALEKLDGIYVGRDFQKAAFLKIGVKPKKSGYLGKMMEGEQGFLYHGQTQSGISYALFLRSFSKTEALEVLSGIELCARKDKGRKTASRTGLKKVISQILLPYAEASESSAACVPRDSAIGLAGANPHALSQILASNSGSGLKETYGCIVGVFKGAWDATGGFAYGVGKLAVNLVTHPIATGAKFWKDINKTWDVVSSFYKDFLGTANSLYRGFEKLDPKTRGQIACEIASSIGTAVLLTYFTAGAGAPQLTKLIAQAFQKLEGTSAVAGVLRSLKKVKRVSTLVAAGTDEATSSLSAGSAVVFDAEHFKGLNGTVVKTLPNGDLVVKGDLPGKHSNVEMQISKSAIAQPMKNGSAASEVLTGNQKGKLVGKYPNGDFLFKSGTEMTRVTPADVAAEVNGGRSVVFDSDHFHGLKGKVVGKYPNGDLVVNADVTHFNGKTSNLNLRVSKSEIAQPIENSSAASEVLTGNQRGKLISKYPNGDFLFKSGTEVTRVTPADVATVAKEGPNVVFDADHFHGLKGKVVGMYPNGDLVVNADVTHFNGKTHNLNLRVPRAAAKRDILEAASTPKAGAASDAERVVFDYRSPYGIASGVSGKIVEKLPNGDLLVNANVTNPFFGNKGNTNVRISMSDVVQPLEKDAFKDEVLVHGNRGSIVGKYSDGDWLFQSGTKSIRVKSDNIAAPVSDGQSVLFDRPGDVGPYNGLKGKVVGTYPNGDLEVNADIPHHLEGTIKNMNVKVTKNDLVQPLEKDAFKDEVLVHGSRGSIVGKYPDGDWLFQSGTKSIRVKSENIAAPVSAGQHVLFDRMGDVGPYNGLKGKVIGTYPNGDMEVNADIPQHLEGTIKNMNVKITKNDLVQPLENEAVRSDVLVYGSRGAIVGRYPDGDWLFQSGTKTARVKSENIAAPVSDGQSVLFDRTGDVGRHIGLKGKVVGTYPNGDLVVNGEIPGHFGEEPENASVRVAKIDLVQPLEKGLVQGEVLSNGSRGTIVGTYTDGTLLYKSGKQSIRVKPEDIASPVGDAQIVQFSVIRFMGERQGARGKVVGRYPNGDLEVNANLQEEHGPNIENRNVRVPKSDLAPQ